MAKRSWRAPPERPRRAGERTKWGRRMHTAYRASPPPQRPAPDGLLELSRELFQLFGDLLRLHSALRRLVQGDAFIGAAVHERRGFEQAGPDRITNRDSHVGYNRIIEGIRGRHTGERTPRPLQRIDKHGQSGQGLGPAMPISRLPLEPAPAELASLLYAELPSHK